MLCPAYTPADYTFLYPQTSLSRASKWSAIPLPKFTTKVIQSAVSGIARHVVSAKEEIEQTVAQSANASVLFHRDPETYHSAKKDLKHAVLEYHRFLELLTNFQVCETYFCAHLRTQSLISIQALNVTAIRKSLKKFEKATGVRD